MYLMTARLHGASLPVLPGTLLTYLTAATALPLVSNKLSSVQIDAVVVILQTGSKGI